METGLLDREENDSPRSLADIDRSSKTDEDMEDKLEKQLISIQKHRVTGEEMILTSLWTS